LAAEEAGCAAWKMLAESALDTLWPLLRPGKAAAHLEGGALYAVAVRSVRSPADNLPKAPPEPEPRLIARLARALCLDAEAFRRAQGSRRSRAPRRSSGALRRHHPPRLMRR